MSMGFGVSVNRCQVGMHPPLRRQIMVQHRQIEFDKDRGYRLHHSVRVHQTLQAVDSDRRALHGQADDDGQQGQAVNPDQLPRRDGSPVHVR